MRAQQRDVVATGKGFVEGAARDRLDIPHRFGERVVPGCVVDGGDAAELAAL